MSTSLFGSVKEVTKSWAARRTLRKSAEKRLYSAVAVIQDLEPRRMLSITNPYPTNGTPIVQEGAGSGTYGIPIAVTTGDLNGDGVPDVVVETQGGELEIFLQQSDGHGKGTGYFYTPSVYALPFDDGGPDNSDLVIGKLPNGDPFIAAAMNDGPVVAILIGDGHGAFSAPYGGVSSEGDITALAVVPNPNINNEYAGLLIGGDFEASVGVTSFIDNIDGLGDAVPVPGGLYETPVTGVAVGDFEGDGATDYVVNTEEGLYVRDQEGFFRAGLPGYTYDSIAVGKLNPNSKADDLVALGEVTNPGVLEYYQRLVTFVGGPGGLPQYASSSYQFNALIHYGQNVQIADVNGDGNPDLLVTNYSGGEDNVYGFSGDGKGDFNSTFNYYTHYIHSSYQSSTYGEYEGHFADMNGDGKADLVFTYYDGFDTADIGVLENNSTITSDPQFTTTPGEFDLGAKFTVGTYSYILISTTGSPTPTITLEGDETLPGGLSFVDEGDGTAKIFGTPAATDKGGLYDVTLVASNGTYNAYLDPIITVNAAPIITSPVAATFNTDSPGTFTVTTTGYPTATITESGPTDGLTFHDNSNGTATISGLATVDGDFPITISATNVEDIAGVYTTVTTTQDFEIVVDQAPAITSAPTDTVTVGTAMPTFDVTTTGFAAFEPVLSISSGSLPAGLLFTDLGTGEGTITGTPDAVTGGSYAFTIEADNGVQPPAYQSFVLIVDQAPVITSTNNTTFTAGKPGTFLVTTTGFPTPALSTIGGVLPPGVSLTDNGNGTATISGTPDIGDNGTYTVDIEAANGVGSDFVQDFTITVDQSPAITSVAASTFTVGDTATFDVTTTGYPAATLSEIGALPAGVVFTTSDGAGILSGTPDVGTGGQYDITIEAKNGIAPTADQSFILTVDQPVAVTSPTGASFTVGTPGSFVITTTGFPIGTLSTSTLPAGLTLQNNGNGTWTISGTPTGTGGTDVVTVTAKNIDDETGTPTTITTTQTLTLTVYAAPIITSTSSFTFTVGTNSTFDIVTTGFPAATLTETGSLPPGLVFNTTNGSGTATISGTPLALTGGQYEVTIEANNGMTPPTYQTDVITVDQAPAITSPNSVTFTVGETGTFIVTTTGFPLAALTEIGSIDGLSFHDNGNGTATLSGTPATGTGGTYSITIDAKNTDDETGTPTTVTTTQAFTLIIDEKPGFLNPPYILTLPNVVDPTESDQSNKVGENFIQLPVGIFDSIEIDTGGYSPDGETLSLVGGSLPQGMTFVDNGDGTATLSGTPNKHDSNTSITVQADYIGVGIIDETIAIRVDAGTAPKITSASSKTLYIGSQDIDGTLPGTAGFFTITTTGFPKANISLIGTVPEGSGGGDIETTADGGTLLADIGLPDLTFTDNGDGTATISGSLQTGVDLPNVYVFTIDANNGIKDVQKTFKLTVLQAIDFTDPTPTDLALGSEWIGTPLDSGQVGDGYDFDVTTNINDIGNLPKAKLSASGLPSGLKFTDNGDGSGTISGTPKKAGTYTVTLTASQGGETQKIKSTLVIDNPPQLKSDSVAVKANSTINTKIGLTGGPGPIAIDPTSISGLPDGLTLTGNGSKTNPELILKGTVSADTYDVTFDLVASDGTTSVVELEIVAS